MTGPWLQAGSEGDGGRRSSCFRGDQCVWRGAGRLPTRFGDNGLNGGAPTTVEESGPNGKTQG